MRDGYDEVETVSYQSESELNKTGQFEAESNGKNSILKRIPSFNKVELHSGESSNDFESRKGSN